MLHIHSCVSSVLPNCTTDFLWETCRRISVVVSASPGRGWQLLLLDDESRRERPTGARASAAAAPLAARPRARPAADVAVGPTAAEALLPAGAAARGATGPRVPPGRRRQPVSPVRHRNARQHPEPRRRDHHGRHHLHRRTNPRISGAVVPVASLPYALACCW